MRLKVNKTENNCKKKELPTWRSCANGETGHDMRRLEHDIDLFIWRPSRRTTNEKMVRSLPLVILICRFSSFGLLKKARIAEVCLVISSPVQVLSSDIDLLHPPLELEKQKHKLKRLVQSPNSFFMDVKCAGCFQM